MELAYQFDNFYAEVDYYINALWFAYEYPNDRSILEIFLPNSLLVNAIPGKNTQPDNIFL